MSDLSRWFTASDQLSFARKLAMSVDADAGALYDFAPFKSFAPNKLRKIGRPHGQWILPGFEATGWQGLFAPAGTPPSIIETLADEVNRIFLLPDVVSSLRKVGGGRETRLARNLVPYHIEVCCRARD
jgi:hypothetical protein